MKALVLIVLLAVGLFYFTGWSKRERYIDRRTPLRAALDDSYGRRDSLIKTLDAGVSLDEIVEKDEDTGAEIRPLQYVLSRGHGSIAELLLSHGARPAFVEAYYGSPLRIAATMDPKLVRRLVELGADPNEGDGWERGTALHALASLTQFRKEGGGEYPAMPVAVAPGEPSASARASASAPERIELASWLIDRGAKLESRNTLGQTPLHVAVQAGDADFAAFLIRRGANVDAKSGGGVTPLLGAALRRDRAIVKLLLAAGADRHARDEAGKELIDKVGDVSGLLKRYGAKDAK